MTYFTVYHGDNEATMFNAECSTGALVGHMLEVLLPHTSIYTRLELVPLAFVLDHFKPAQGSIHATSTPRGGQQQQDALSEISVTTVKSSPFTGTIPLVGLAARPIESYADAVLGGSSAAIYTSAPAAAAAATAIAASASATGASAAALGAPGCSATGYATTPASLQTCYVLLGCRHQHQQRSEGLHSSSSHVASIGWHPGNKMDSASFRRFCSTDTVLDEQRAASARRAQLISSVPIAATNTKGSAAGGGNNNNNRQTGQQTHGSSTAPAAAANGTIVDAALLLAHTSGLSLAGDANAPWRKAFSQYIATLILPPVMEGKDGAPALNRQPTPIAESQEVEPDLETRDNAAALLPPVATGMFFPPTPPITGYDVLWRGTRGEHQRLQEALDERVFTEAETKKKKPKRA